MKYLIVRPKYGLCNQLYSISKGIIFGLISSRDVIFSNFQMDYRMENNTCNFENIIDIEHLQNIIDKKNLNINIQSNNNINNSIKIKTNSNINISDLKDFIPLLLNKDNSSVQYLDIDNPISANIPFEYQRLEYYINIHIKFTDHYINLANNIKKIYNLNNYVCIHLRLEDDSLNFIKSFNKDLSIEQINNIYKKKYIDQIEKIYDKNKKIYVCTSLCINDNINNNFYKEIKEKYNLIDKNEYIDINNNYREIYAIIDYIIAKDSYMFIGSDWSSFSIYIYHNHSYYNKPYKLIDIWTEINNKKINK
jgi:hypothetical protein